MKSDLPRWLNPPYADPVYVAASRMPYMSIREPSAYVERVDPLA